MNFQKIRKLLKKVPFPPEEGIPDGVGEEEILDLENRIGMKIPSQLRSMLKETNGPCAGPGGIFGIHPKGASQDFEEVLNVFPSWKERGWLPVAGDGCGNFYVMPLNESFGSNPPVFFIDTHEDANTFTFIVGSSLVSFLEFLLEKELGQGGWPFDKDYVLSNDRQITNFSKVCLPWE